MADYDGFSVVRRLAGCDGECVIESMRDDRGLYSLAYHYQRGNPPSNESVMRLDDDVFRQYRGFEERKQWVISRFRADHDHWANKPVSLYDFDEEAERARLQPV